MKFIFLFLSALTISSLLGQSIEREVISSGGDFYSNGNGQLSVTLGEPITETFTDGTNDLTQGFHQTEIVISTIENYEEQLNISVFPNPASDYITITMEEEGGNMEISLTGSEGKLILKKKITYPETKLNLYPLAKGIYFLTINNQHHLIKSYKIIKE